MDHFLQIYANQAREYHQMIVLEDVDGNLRRVIDNVRPMRGQRVLDLGTRWLATDKMF